jgi:hypothetical protein
MHRSRTFPVVVSAAIVAVLSLAGCAGPGLTAQEIRVTLTGVEEVPPNKSTATGKGTFWVHADRTINGVVETSGVEATAAYIYVGDRGKVGTPAIELARTSSDGPAAMEHTPVSGASWSLARNARFSDEQYRAFLAGQTYVNVHSARYPDGEIRAQLKP